MSRRSDEEEPPWERGRRQRRDYEPHRGDLVRALGNVSLALGALAMCGGVTGVVALPMAITAWIMAREDLAKMRAGLMDRRGEQKTRKGGDCAVFGMLLSFFFVVGYTLLALDRFLPPPYGTNE